MEKKKRKTFSLEEMLLFSKSPSPFLLYVMLRVRTNIYYVSTAEIDIRLIICRANDFTKANNDSTKYIGIFQVALNGPG